MRSLAASTAVLVLSAGSSLAADVVTAAEITGKYFTAADGFETHFIHPLWAGDRLVVEDVRLFGNYPEIAGTLPRGSVGQGTRHPASMLNGILVYVAPLLLGGMQPQTVVFHRTGSPATSGIHAIPSFDGPPGGPPSLFSATMRTGAEWAAFQQPGRRDPVATNQAGTPPVAQSPPPS